MCPTSEGNLTDNEEASIDEAASESALPDPVTLFGRVAATGTPLLVDVGDWFAREFAYSSHPENGGGRENHFQGCQLLSDGQHLAVSGGDPHKKSRMSHLFIVHLGSASSPAKVLRRVDIERERWHAGGIDACGDLLAVPIECSKRPGLFDRAIDAITGNPGAYCPSDRSKIVFYWVADPENPIRLVTVIDRLDCKAGAVAITRADDRYLLAVLSGGDIDVYWSNDGNLASAFGQPMRKAAPVGLRDSAGLDWLRSTDGDLLLAGFGNSADVAPTFRGENLARLFRVTLTPTLALQPVDCAREPFVCPDGVINFDAAVGISVHNHALEIDTVFHFVHTNTGRLQIARFTHAV